MGHYYVSVPEVVPSEMLRLSQGFWATLFVAFLPFSFPLKYTEKAPCLQPVAPLHVGIFPIKKDAFLRLFA
jgi:hypothetical protein